MPTIAQRIDMAVKQAEERLAAAKRAKELFVEAMRYLGAEENPKT